MAMEIIKQLYDIGTIFQNISEFDATKQAFKDFAREQLKDRKLGDDIILVLDDIYDTALTLSTRGSAGSAKFDILQQGINKVNRFIFSESYHIEKAIIDASKAAYLAYLIKHNKNRVEKFTNALEVKDWNIKQPFNTRLNKLKKSNPEAFFYWYRIYDIDNPDRSSTK